MSRLEKINMTYLITIIFALTGSVILSAFHLLEEDPLMRLLFSQILYIVPAAIYLAVNKESPIKALRWNRIPIFNLVLLLLFTFFIMPLLSFLNAFSMLFVTNSISNTVARISVMYPLPIGLLCVALLPAIFEESVYRGVFFDEYRKIHPLQGMVLSGLLFGMLHLNLNQFLYAFVMGMIFALLVEVNDSIIASIFVHCLINGVSTIIMYMNQQEGESAASAINRNELGGMVAALGFLALFSTAAAYALLCAMAKRKGRKLPWKGRIKKNGMKSVGLFTPPLAAGIVICTVIMIYVEIVSR